MNSQNVQETSIALNQISNIYFFICCNFRFTYFLILLIHCFATGLALRKYFYCMKYTFYLYMRIIISTKNYRMLEKLY